VGLGERPGALGVGVEDGHQSRSVGFGYGTGMPVTGSPGAEDRNAQVWLGPGLAHRPEVYQW
jgi:hypothetical protein